VKRNIKIAIAPLFGVFCLVCLYCFVGFAQTSFDEISPDVFDTETQVENLQGDSIILMNPSPVQSSPFESNSISQNTASQAPELNVAKLFDAVRFGFGNSQLSGQAKRQLLGVSDELQAFPSETIVEVTGHTDNRGSEAHNLLLSRLRAISVLDYLSSKNIHHRFVLVASGEYEPLATNATDQGRAINRRVEVEVLSTHGVPQDAPVVVSEPLAPAENVIQEPNVLVGGPAPEQEEIVPSPVGIDQTEVIDVTQNDTNQIPMVVAQEVTVTASEEAKEGTSHIVAHNDQPQQNGERLLHHVYERRKKPGEGTSEVYAGPMLNRLSHLSALGAPTDSKQSQLSWEMGARWTSLMEDLGDTFVTLDIFGRVDRFNADSSINLLSNERQWSFGGTFWAGTYLFKSLSVAAGVGAGREPYLKLNQGNLNYTSDFIGHIGLKSELVAWRFSHEGDVGVYGQMKYHNVPFGDLDSGWQYGGGIFADYRDYRLSLNVFASDFDALGTKTQFQRFSLILSSYF